MKLRLNDSVAQVAGEGYTYYVLQQAKERNAADGRFVVVMVSGPVGNTLGEKPRISEALEVIAGKERQKGL